MITKVEWITTNAPVFFGVLRHHAKDKKRGIIQYDFFEKDISIHVLPNFDGPITILPYKLPAATESPNSETLLSEGKTVKCSNASKSEEPVLRDERIDEAETLYPRRSNQEISLSACGPRRADGTNVLCTSS